MHTPPECPYCRTPLTDTATECPACNLSFPRTKTLLGAFPRFHPGISDADNLLTPAEIRKIRRRLLRLRDRFRQIETQVILHRFPPQHPFSLYAFWIFNGGFLSGQSNRGSANFAILLLLDVSRREAALIPGYGLEPYLSATALEKTIAEGAPAWAADHWAEGLIWTLEALETLLESTAGLQSRFQPDDGF